MLKKRVKRREGLTLYPPLRLIVVCCIKSLILCPPRVKSRGLFEKRFICCVLVPLRKILDFPAFPLSLDVMNKKSDIAAER